MNWALIGQWTVGVVVLLILLGAIAAAYKGWKFDAAWDEAILMNQRWDDARAQDRLRDRLKIADRIASLPEHKKQRLQREAEMRGFLDEGTTA